MLSALAKLTDNQQGKLPMFHSKDIAVVVRYVGERVMDDKIPWQAKFTYLKACASLRHYHPDSHLALVHHPGLPDAIQAAALPQLAALSEFLIVIGSQLDNVGDLAWHVVQATRSKLEP